MPGTERTISVARAAKDAGLELAVNLSSIGVSLDPMSVGREQRAREDALASAGLPTTNLRPSNFMSNALFWAESIRSEGVVRDPVGPGRLSLIDPADVAAVAVTAPTGAGHRGRVYDLTGPQLLTPREQTEILAATLRRPIRYVEQTPDTVVMDASLE